MTAYSKNKIIEIHSKLIHSVQWSSTNELYIILNFADTQDPGYIENYSSISFKVFKDFLDSSDKDHYYITNFKYKTL